MTQPVQPFRLDLIHLVQPMALSRIGGYRGRKGPDLFSQFGNREADNFE